MTEKDINLTDLGPPIQGEIPGLRDFFATSAMSICSSEWFFEHYNEDPSHIAEFCYDVADAMMKEKQKRKGK